MDFVVNLSYIVAISSLISVILLYKWLEIGKWNKPLPSKRKKQILINFADILLIHALEM